MESHQVARLLVLVLFSGQVWSVPDDIEVKSPLKHPFELLHNCQGPDNRLGNCVDIRDCDELLKKLISEPQSSQLTGFLRTSNELCKSRGFSTGQKVCCPIGRATVADIPQSPPLLHRPPIEAPVQHPQPYFPPQAKNPASEQPPLLHRPPTEATSQSPPLLHGPPIEAAVQQPLFPPQPLPVVPLEVRSFPGCGIAKQNTFRKLIAGEEALAATWPWVAAIGYYSNGEIKFNCAGSLITDRHILTSAQCVTPDMSIVRLGALNINSTDGVNVPIEQGLVHGGFNSQTLQNDIAIIVLTQKLQFSETIRPICLPISKELQEMDFSGYHPITAGWRTNKRHENERESSLRQFQIKVLSSSSCKAQFNGLFTVDDNFVCAGSPNEKFLAGIGGSLMYPEQKGDEFAYHALGVLSYGENSVQRDSMMPGLYTRVASHTSWIQSQIQST